MEENPNAPTPAQPEPMVPTSPAGPAPQEPIMSAEPMGSVVETQPKKKKTGLIVGILIMLLLLGGAIACILIFSSSPEKDAQTASIKFFDTLSAVLSPETSTAENKNIKIDGRIDAKIKPASSSQETNVGLNLILEANDRSDARAFVDLDLGDVLTEYNAEVPEINLETREIYSKSNYLKLNGVSDILSDMLGSSGSEFNSVISPIIEQIDGKWLELDLDKIAEKASEMNPYSYQDDETEKQAKCLTDEITVDKITALIDPNDLAEALSLVIYEGEDKKAEKGTVYTLEIDAEGTAKLFNNYLKKYQAKIKEVSEKCGVEDSTKSLYENEKEIKAEDLKEYIDKIPEIFVTIENKEITNLSTKYVDDDYDISVILNFSYPKTLEIEEPANAKPVSEFVDEIYTTIQDLIGGNGGIYPEPTDCLTDDGSCTNPDDDALRLDPKVKACLKELGYEIETYDDFYANSEAYSAWAGSDC